MTVGIVAFAKDWHEDPTSNHHVLRELARHQRVLWLNSVGTRTPNLASGRDLGKIARKLGEFARGPVNVENDLWVFSPLVLPLPHVPAARAANQRILRATIWALRQRLRMREFDLWTFLPTTGDYVGTLGERASVYYCVDEWSMFSYVDRDQTVANERALLAKVDVVFAINHALADAKRLQHPDVHVAPHGVDHVAFAKALDPATRIPDDIARLRRPGHPTIGFYGTLQDWVDYDLLRKLAQRHPEWDVVLIGQQLADVSAVQGLANVHLLGRRPGDTLPAYCKAFDVGLIPYRIDERMTFVNPIKLREYLAAGVPVVSTAVPEVRRYPTLATVADDHDAFIAGVERALATDSPAARAARSAAMHDETWQGRVAACGSAVERSVAARR